jgi:hypothetical protein
MEVQIAQAWRMFLCCVVKFGRQLKSLWKQDARAHIFHKYFVADLDEKPIAHKRGRRLWPVLKLQCFVFDDYGTARD